jgi:hypothetical protein
MCDYCAKRSADANSARYRAAEIALGRGSDVDPLLGAVGIECGPGSSVALGRQVSSICSRPDSVLAANPKLRYIPLMQSC